MKKQSTHSPRTLVGTQNDVRGIHRAGHRGSVSNFAAVLAVMMLLATIGGTFASHQLGQSERTASVTKDARSVTGRTGQSIRLVRSVRALSVKTFAPPASISDNCSKDVTGPLNFWFAILPRDATVNLPRNACYLVSNSSSSLLTIQHTFGLTINGNDTTFKQNTYNSAGDPQSPVLTIGGNFALTVNDVTLFGPSSNGGWNSEGNAGILMWQNFAVQLNGITITNVEGDGMDLYPNYTGTPGAGVNWYVNLNHSTIENVGYKAIVPEAADHFTVENSTLISDDIDAEVDFSCQPPQLPLADCGTFADPSVGLVNMTLKNDSFPNGLALEDEMSCMPVGNWVIKDNNFGTGGLVAQFDATYSLTLSALQTCGPQSGLTIEGNTSSNSQPPCCGVGSPYVLLQGWANVTIANNHFVYDLNQGLVGGPVVEFWGDKNVAITNNAFINYYNITLSDAPSGWPATTGVTDCGNITGPPQYPIVQSACP
jgi:hypothetical protein